MNQWALDPWTLLAIAAMTLGSYGNRAGGYLLFRTLRPRRWMQTALDYVPGTLFVSYVVPALTSGGLQPWCGAMATAAAMLLTRNLSIAIIAGTAAAWAVWAWG